MSKKTIAKCRKETQRLSKVPSSPRMVGMGNMDKKDRGELFDAIMIYGCFELEPTNLDGDILEYFNKEIRPELDKQHKRLKEGKEI